MAKTKIEEFEMDFNVYYNGVSFRVKNGEIKLINISYYYFIII